MGVSTRRSRSPAALHVASPFPASRRRTYGKAGSGWSPTRMRGSIIRTSSPRTRTPSVEGVSYSQSSLRGRSLTARRRESKGRASAAPTTSWLGGERCETRSCLAICENAGTSEADCLTSESRRYARGRLSPKLKDYRACTTKPYQHCRWLDARDHCPLG